VPVAITRHGDTVGYYIPARRKRAETERAALKEAASRLQQVLAAEGISEDEILADFKSWRVGWVHSSWNARFRYTNTARPTAQLSRKLLSWLLLRPMADRHPSKPELTPSRRTLSCGPTRRSAWPQPSRSFLSRSGERLTHQRFERFILREMLGRGGMGELWSARGGTGPVCGTKFLRRKTAPNFTLRTLLARKMTRSTTSGQVGLQQLFDLG